MIICLSPDEAFALHDVRYFSRLYGEKIALLKENCFDEYKGEKRITFLGHASKERYGEQALTPEQFIENLVRFGLPRDIKTIDLIGCGIGELANQTTYAHRAAKLLYDNGYPDVRVNSFSSLVYDKEDIIGLVVESESESESKSKSESKSESKLESKSKLKSNSNGALEEKNKITLTEEKAKQYQIDKDKIEEQIKLLSSEKDALIEMTDDLGDRSVGSVEWITVRQVIRAAYQKEIETQRKDLEMKYFLPEDVKHNFMLKAVSEKKKELLANKENTILKEHAVFIKTCVKDKSLLLKEIKELEEKIGLPSSESKTVLASEMKSDPDQVKLAKLKSLYLAASKILEKVEREKYNMLAGAEYTPEFEQHEFEVFKTDDVRRAFDDNPNFQITRESLDIPRLDKEKIRAITILNNEISKINQASSTSSLSIFSASPSDSKQLASLKKLITIVKETELKDMPARIDAVMEEEKGLLTAVNVLRASGSPYKEVLERYLEVKMPQLSVAVPVAPEVKLSVAVPVAPRGIVPSLFAPAPTIVPEVKRSSEDELYALMRDVFLNKNIEKFLGYKESPDFIFNKTRVIKTILDNPDLSTHKKIDLIKSECKDVVDLMDASKRMFFSTVVQRSESIRKIFLSLTDPNPGTLPQLQDAKNEIEAFVVALKEGKEMKG